MTGGLVPGTREIKGAVIDHPTPLHCIRRFQTRHPILRAPVD